MAASYHAHMNADRDLLEHMNFALEEDDLRYTGTIKVLHLMESARRSYRRHGKIDIFLDDAGDVERAYFQVPELRGFERFAQGRLAEDMPQITSRVCGVCPTAHHMAGTKALDDFAPPG